MTAVWIIDTNEFRSVCDVEATRLLDSQREKERHLEKPGYCLQSLFEIMKFTAQTVWIIVTEFISFE